MARTRKKQKRQLKIAARRLSEDRQVHEQLRLAAQRLGEFAADIEWALTVLEISGGRIKGITNFLDTARLFPLFGLPERLDPAPAATTSGN